MANSPHVKSPYKILVTSALPYVNNVPHMGTIIGCVLSADVSEETRHNVLHRNAEELLRPFLGANAI